MIDLSKVDVFYPIIKTKDNNLELRFSLRSLENLPHRKVFVYGDKIEWLRNVEFPNYKRPDKKGKFYDVNCKILSACLDENVSDPFILMNDDFYVMKPQDSLPFYCLGTLIEKYNSYEIKGTYAQDVLRANMALKIMNLPRLDFDPHIPILIYKKPMLKVLEKYMHSGHRRSIYANSLKDKSVAMLERDVKVYDMDLFFDENLPFLSSASLHGLNNLRSFLGKKFPVPCIYEKEFLGGGADS